MGSLQETHFRSKDKNRLKVNGWKKIFNENSNQKRAGAILTTGKTDFKSKNVTRDKTTLYTDKRVNLSGR